MTLQWLIQTYGYPVLFLGTFLEGETVLVAAGFAAHEGYLSVTGVLLTASLGGFAGDQMWFYIGRRRGRPWVEGRPRWRSRIATIEGMLTRHELLVLLGFRFLYGFRTITPVVIGATGYSALRFLILNAIGSMAWATIIGLAGFVFGNAMEWILTDVKRYEQWLLLFLGVAGLVILAWHRIRERRRT